MSRPLPAGASLADDDAARARFEAFARALGEAYERFGFVILENHGIEQGLIERVMERSRAFFARDEACKRKYTLEGLGGARGYTSFGVEQAKGANVPGA